MTDIFPSQIDYILPMKYISYSDYFEGKAFDENGIRKKQILAEGTYKDYKWYIVSYRTHPCAYIVTKMNDPCYKKPYSQINLDVHGGLTYSEYGLKNIIEDTEWVIGWDYAHYGDYTPYSVEKNKKWTTIEICYDIIRAIDTIADSNDIIK